MKKAFVLLSGGVDSTTCLHQAIMDYMPPDPNINLAYGDKQVWRETLLLATTGDIEIPWVEAVSVFYGQRHKKEMMYAQNTCHRLGIKHTVLDVGAILSGRSVMLTEASRGAVEVPNISYSDIQGVSPTYVPFRNGTLLAVITAHAQKWVNEEIEDRMNTHLQERDVDNEKDAREYASQNVGAGVYFGAHSEDAANWAYPDCTPEFIGAMANAIWVGSYMKIRLHTPIQWDMKSDVVTRGTKLGVSWPDTWSCYKGEELHCGTCPTCRSRKEAFIAAEVPDPTLYAA